MGVVDRDGDLGSVCGQSLGTQGTTCLDRLVRDCRRRDTCIACRIMVLPRFYGSELLLPSLSNIDFDSKATPGQ
jgi:hypothetical protein